MYDPIREADDRLSQQALADEDNQRLLDAYIDDLVGDTRDLLLQLARVQREIDRLFETGAPDLAPDYVLLQALRARERRLLAQLAAQAAD